MVGNSVLDAEHNHLGAALRNADSKIALVAAVVEMEEHFAHEEAMLREADFPTRALAGHIADHDRIRALAADAIAHLSLAGECWMRPGPSLPPSVSTLGSLTCSTPRWWAAGVHTTSSGTRCIVRGLAQNTYNV